MNQEQYDRILNQLPDDEDRAAMKRLWRKFKTYEGAVLFAKTPEIHVHYHDKEDACQMTPNS